MKSNKKVLVKEIIIRLLDSDNQMGTFLSNRLKILCIELLYTCCPADEQHGCHFFQINVSGKMEHS